MEDLFQRDTLVLRHLRGYPEDLRHYSNLIKQAHPRGTSALQFVLNRPTASDSYVAAVCRFIAAGESVLSAVETAEVLGMPVRAFLETTADRPDFPAPLFANGDRRLWRASEIEAYRAGAAGPDATDPGATHPGTSRLAGNT